MNRFVEGLKKWYDGLSEVDKKAVYDYLYGEGSYSRQKKIGTHHFGVKTGPAPTSISRRRCPKCGQILS